LALCAARLGAQQSTTSARRGETDVVDCCAPRRAAQRAKASVATTAADVIGDD